MEEIVDGFSEGEVPCKGCGRTIRLFFNGGELDRKQCCGYEYETEATGYRLVIRNTRDADAVARGSANQPR